MTGHPSAPPWPACRNTIPETDLAPDLATGRLLTGEDCSYYESDPIRCRSFEIVLKRGPDGRFLPEVVGFMFGGSLYTLVGE